MDTSQLTQGAPNLGPDRLVFRDPYPLDATCDVLASDDVQLPERLVRAMRS